MVVLHACRCSKLSTYSTWSAHLHVVFELVVALQIIHVALDGHVVEAEQVVELDAKGFLELLLVCSLQRHTPLLVSLWRNPIRTRHQQAAL
jgi:hypothetical protein